MDTKFAKILIVDDEISEIDLLVSLLQEKYKTIIAKNGLQALKRTQTLPRPDLILLDIMMPDMNGFEVCLHLKSEQATSDIPIIFITGQDDPQEETKALAVGAVDFIRKPFSPAVVLARIDTHLALQQQKLHLQELNVLKNKFIGMAAHDLRNPLNSICGYCDVLLTTELEADEQKHFVQTIDDVATQMVSMINDLLDVTVIESGNFSLNLQLNNLADLVAARVQLMMFTAAKKGITMATDLSITPVARFDADRLAQVIDNLLSNAIKFTPPNTQITIRTGQQRERIFVQVSDQGTGVPEAEQHKLYQAFQKLSVRPTARERGTGLGLAIVKSIMDAHSGEIRFANNPDKGATFTCYLSNHSNS